MIEKVRLASGGTAVSPLYVQRDEQGYRAGLRPEDVNGIPAENTVYQMFLAERRRMSGYDTGHSRMGLDQLTDFILGGRSPQGLMELIAETMVEVTSKLEKPEEELEKWEIVDYTLGTLLTKQYKPELLN
ncbi:hypothetical protein HOE37_03515 [Candidatus Woesearchaeota archaeon]|jgi:hypothetical protein|nr:hypothetical protein [Candidatus Woesearchaeota archaeon]MBT4110899.1 hypothetical protein [Candidatus Woesearchaeota archaeon]MBT4336589.1 hypothetical protein [Candidatus Woesearchaeota archaeon]MBT4469662.1 hypothetical protein [Candidatus Woesearchaeota archaeon]MBT6744024.1 hypothetical protein [Candidatus Woesearchaeota archaeon]